MNILILSFLALIKAQIEQMELIEPNQEGSADYQSQCEKEDILVECRLDYVKFTRISLESSCLGIKRRKLFWFPELISS